MTITEKRAALLKEWCLSRYANNENYYLSTISCGVPDGDGYKTVIEDLKSGFYDDDINEMLEVYENAKKRYGKDGYYINDVLYYDEAEALQEIEKTNNIKLPTKIYKG